MCPCEQRWFWKNTRFCDTEHTIKVKRMLLYLLYFMPACSHDDNVLDGAYNWDQEAADKVLLHERGLWQPWIHRDSSYVKLATHLFLCLKCIQHTNEGNTVAHLYWKAVLYWQDFQLLPGNHTSYGGIIRPSPPAPRSKRFVCLDQSPGQSTAVGASDCKTLMNVRRLKPTSHLAGWRQWRESTIDLCHVYSPAA